MMDWLVDLFINPSPLVHNEIAKLTATFWNNAAVGAFGTGVVLPMLSDKPKILSRGSIFVLGLVLAVVFHWIARAFLTAMH